MDEVDARIIGILKENSRTPFTEIARALDLSEGAVRQRVRNLAESGVIKRFTVETSEDNPTAIVFVSTSPKVPVPKIARDVSALPRVESVMEVAGQFDISVIVSGSDVSLVNQCIDAIREVDGVQATNTLFVLRMWK